MKIILRLLSVFMCIFIVSCNKKQTLFTSLKTSKTKVDFENTIQEDSIHNMFNFMNIYTGGGVGIIDVNNDGLSDIFFSGNIVSNKLYLNKGNFQFQDITKSAKIASNKWCTGVAVADVNQDGWSDIYVSVSGSAPIAERANLLYINQKDNTFKEEAEKYGLADTSQSTQASFFDYDLDGDLDMFLIVNPVDYSMSNVNTVKPRSLNGEAPSTDKLYRNNGNGTFTDVSKEAGILIEGYSLGVGVSDINNDGWPDVYVSNDFMTNDIMYINNKNGTFTDKSHQWLKHTSFAGMGNDLSDVNNDGHTDIMVLDMLPEDNKRQKMIIPSSNYDKFLLMKSRGYQEQYNRNTLQLNNGDNTFSEIAYLSGVSSTDWSWSVLLADYNQDGNKDVFVTNGFTRDVGNLDYIHFKQQSFQPFGTKEARKKREIEAIKNAPRAKIKNYLYRNNGDLTFTKVSEEWGIKKSGLSNGAAYADLDNDGDLDLVINNINEPAGILKNNSEKISQNSYLKIKLVGSQNNINGIGAKIKVSNNNQHQYYQHFLSRGYQSSVDKNIIFGFKETQKVDSINITWPNGKNQTLINQPTDTLITINYANATLKKATTNNTYTKTYFEELKDTLIKYKHQENDFIDFKIQPIIPRMHSKQGPRMTVGDINSDELQDVFIGGSLGQKGIFFIQQADGSFYEKPMDVDAEFEDTDVLLFDADNDSDLDLYVVSGGTEFQNKTENYQDRLYINDGKGNFERNLKALPKITASGSIVKEIDYDKDGDLDLFVGGRVSAGNYPLPTKSYILKNNNGVFEDVTSNSCEKLNNIGMVTDALWTDYNNDGSIDLMLVGEFMQIKVFENNTKGIFKDVTNTLGLKNTHGWWNTLAQGDFDNDGDIDYLVGNWGINSKYKATESEPLCIYAKDFDNNGRIDPVMCYYVEGENYLFHPRDAMINQINGMKGRFKTYESYAEAKFEESFTKKELEDAHIVKSETFYTSYIENLDGKGFKIHKLPNVVQFAPISAIKILDINDDGNLDAILVGNDYSNEAYVGMHDAMNGLCLLGDGKGGFKYLKSKETGLYASADAKDIEIINHKKNKPLILVSSNADSLKVFKLKQQNVKK